LFLQHVKTREETHKAMECLGNSIKELAGQLERLNEVPKSDQLRSTMREFPDIMEEVVNFMRGWLKGQICMSPVIFIWVDL